MGTVPESFVDVQQVPPFAARAPARLRALLKTTRKHHLVAACMMAFLAHTPARAQPAYGVPSADGAKGLSERITGRLSEWRAMIESARMRSDQEKLDSVNRFFNRSLLFASDIDTWGAKDHWSTPMEFIERGRGDCEDFAIAKYVSLRMLGFGGERLRLQYVHAQVGAGKPIAHMVLAFYERPGADPLVLDNVIDSVRRASTRTDLSLVYSFNTRGLWVGDGPASAAEPTKRLSRWRGLLQRMRGEGMLSWSPSLVAMQSRFRDTTTRH
jgi:predicted transglutaminase-like cysteine proteinase